MITRATFEVRAGASRLGTNARSTCDLGDHVSYCPSRLPSGTAPTAPLLATAPRSARHDPHPHGTRSPPAMSPAQPARGAVRSVLPVTTQSSLISLCDLEFEYRNRLGGTSVTRLVTDQFPSPPVLCQRIVLEEATLSRGENLQWRTRPWSGLLLARGIRGIPSVDLA